MAGMLTGRVFTLKSPTVSILASGDTASTKIIPAGAVVKVLEGPTATEKRLIKIQWNDSTLMMFLVHLQQRGEEITDGASGS